MEKKISEKLVEELKVCLEASNNAIWHVVFDRSFPNATMYDAQLRLQNTIVSMAREHSLPVYGYNVSSHLLKNSCVALLEDPDPVTLPRVRISPASMQPANLNHAWREIAKAVKEAPGKEHNLILVVREKTELLPAARSKGWEGSLEFKQALVIPVDSAAKESSRRVFADAFFKGDTRIRADEISMFCPLVEEATNQPKRKYVRKPQQPDLVKMPAESANSGAVTITKAAPADKKSLYTDRDCYASICYSIVDGQYDGGVMSLIKGTLQYAIDKFRGICKEAKPNRAVLMHVVSNAIISEYEVKEIFSLKPEIEKEVGALIAL